MSTPLNVFAQLSLTDENGKEMSVSAENEIITVMIPSLWATRPMFRLFTNRQQRISCQRCSLITRFIGEGAGNSRLENCGRGGDNQIPLIDAIESRCIAITAIIEKRHRREDASHRHRSQGAA